jgi:hypothetical protein
MTKQMFLLAVFVLWVTPWAYAQSAEQRTAFQVRYVSAGALYLDGGRNDGLAVGMTLQLRRVPEGGPILGGTTLGQVEVIAVASNSAACAVSSPDTDVRVGDLAVLSIEDVERIRSKAAGETRKYAQVIGFTAEDSLEQEQRDYVPRPPLPEVNRVNMSITFEHSIIVDHGASGSRSTQEGMAVRANMTRIGGTHWNFTGYWRGRRNLRRQAGQLETLSDLLNRTYHINLSYNNPQSKNVAGLGRLLLPWATSLSTLDGGYYGRRLGRSTTLGLFGGSTPDPSAWNFDPDRHIFGVFGNLEKGSFDAVRYSGTVGVAQTRLQWKPERQFLFSENNFLFRRGLSIYHNLEADYRSGDQFANSGERIAFTRSFLTFRAQPQEWIAFDLSHNYFQDVPTSDPRLVGTGLLDKVLFQGLSGGIRLRPVQTITLYSSLGRSERNGDAKPSWNYQYGLTLERIPLLELRADARMSRFDSSFGTGTYYTGSLVRTIADTIHLELQGGKQSFRSALTSDNGARWLTANIDVFLGRHYILGASGTQYRGEIQDYDQWFFSGGFRF